MIGTFLHGTVINRFNFYFKDILREKSNHIEQLMKEREQDREESAAQAILFKKNVDLVNILSLCRLWAFYESSVSKSARRLIWMTTRVAGQL